MGNFLGVRIGVAGSKYELAYQATADPSKMAAWIATGSTGQSSSTKRNAWGAGSFEASPWDAVTLGKGKFGQVALVQGEKDRLFYAVKAIPKELIWERKSAEGVHAELATLARLSGEHPFLCHCFGAWQDSCGVYMVLEYLAGGELFNRLKRVGRFSEEVARFYTAEVALALAHLHTECLIAYRDLKPENLMICSMGHVRLVDFGFARTLSSPDELILTGGCGTAMYVSPEIAAGSSKQGLGTKGHGLSSDWWSLGVVIFEMVAGKAPFGDTATKSKFEIFNRINSGRVTYPLSFSSDLKALLRGLLCLDTTQRFGWDQVKASPWLKKVDWDATMACRANPPWVPAFPSGAGDHSNFLNWDSKAKSKPRAPPDAEASSYCNIKIPDGGGRGGGVSNAVAQFSSTGLVVNLMAKRLKRRASAAKVAVSKREIDALKSPKGGGGGTPGGGGGGGGGSTKASSKRRASLQHHHLPTSGGGGGGGGSGPLHGLKDRSMGNKGRGGGAASSSSSSKRRMSVV